jgi:hypothetical protein
MRDRNAYRVLVGKLRERDHLKVVDVDGCIVLNLIFKIEDVKFCVEFVWL